MPLVRPRQVVPHSWSGKASGLFLVILPTIGLILLAGWLLLKQKQMMDDVVQNNKLIQNQVLQLGKIIIDFNLERELTLIFTTARDKDSQNASKIALDRARHYTDQSLAQLQRWPGSPLDGHLLKSRYLFSAVLGRHRSLVKVGNYFMDELFFYTNTMDVFYNWLNREFKRIDSHPSFPWLLTYTYLQGSIIYLGAEQALCSVYFSVICLSHRETFHYANYSFAGEAAFRLYRQTYPEAREDSGWTKRSHRHFFPQLFACREEIFADMDYHGVAIDPSVCDFSRKNETRFYDTDVLLVEEHGRIVEQLLQRNQQHAYNATMRLLWLLVLTGCSICYLLVGHVLRCIWIRCTQRKHGDYRLSDSGPHAEEETKLDHVEYNSTSHVTRYNDHRHNNTNYIHANHSLQRPLKPIINSRPAPLPKVRIATV